MVIIYTTLENTDQAEAIAQTLIDERLIACANFWPISSMYTWNNQLEKTSEIIMWLKTSQEKQEALRKRLPELHPYECPAVITLDAKQDNPAFNQWMQSQMDSGC